MVKQMYNRLLKKYGPQGWWPLQEHKGVNMTKTGSSKGYHPGDFDFPKNERQRFEICVGAILTQNTNWANVEKALTGLGKVSCSKIIKMDIDELKKRIRPAGYYNQKARKLKEFAEFYNRLKRKPTREELLSIWGIGPETADSMLLYAWKEPRFVVDAYTKRIFGMEGKDYDDVQKHFEKKLPKDHKVYQEYHALIVEHAKRIK